MSVTHVSSVGDPPGSVSSASVETYTCNCACAVCMSGSCCMFPSPTLPTVRVSASTFVPGPPTECAPTSHHYAKLKRRTLFCRQCGKTLEV